MKGLSGLVKKQARSTAEVKATHSDFARSPKILEFYGPAGSVT